MKPVKPRIQTIKGGSSSIKVACLHQILEGGIERIGLPDTMLPVKSLNQAKNVSRSVTIPGHAIAVRVLMECIERRSGGDALTAAGHRLVHGGPTYWKPQQINSTRLSSGNLSYETLREFAHEFARSSLRRYERQSCRGAAGIARDQHHLRSSIQICRTCSRDRPLVSSTQ